MTSPQLGSGAMFDRIAARYDLLNRLLSLGLDGLWRRRTANALDLQRKSRVLDVATGTADLALAIASSQPDVEVVGIDAAPIMLERAKRKILDHELSGRIHLLVGEAGSLPFQPGSFDACTMAFGIRNMPNRPAILAEMRRVTRPGGRLAILELTQPNRGWLAPLARWYLRHMVPALGSLISAGDEYRYLAESIARFPAPEVFVRTISEAGFEQIRVDAMPFRVAHLYLARARGSP